MLAGRASLLEARLHHPEGDFDIIAGRSGSGTLSGISAAALDLLLDRLKELAPAGKSARESVERP